MTLVNRWYQLLKLLVTHKKVSIQEVQKEIKTSNQTIKKDIGELNEEIAGIAKIVQKNRHFELEIYDFDFMKKLFLIREKQPVISIRHPKESLIY
ncbi:hypothetical protein EfmJHP10_15440 [Enterococcus faecium]|nr:hypothetical protein EfmJHP10_15440 [Enterococcus faecium]